MKSRNFKLQKSSLLNLVVMVIALARTSIYAGYSPVPLTPGSFTYKIVVPASYVGAPWQNAVDTTMDSGPAIGGPVNYTNAAGYTFYETGCNPASLTTGLPHAGGLLTNQFQTDHVFRFAPSYIGADVLFIGNYAGIPVRPYPNIANSDYTSGSLTPVTPQAFSALSFLASSGNSGCNMNCSVSHADGTVETFNNFIVADWFNTAGNTNTPAGGSYPNVFAYSAGGRVNNGGYNNVGVATTCKLSSVDITLTDTTSPVTNITFTFASTGSGGRTMIFAVSGSTGTGFSPIAVTGYDADGILEAPAVTSPLLPYNATMDNGTNFTAGGGGGNTWFEMGWDPYHPSRGFPAHGSTITSVATGRPYNMASDYSLPMCTLVDTNHPIISITPANPLPYTAFSILSAGANIGSGKNMTNIILLQHADGTTETNLFIANDWFDNTIPYAYAAGGRVNFSKARAFDLQANCTNANSDPHLFESQFQLKNTASPVTNIVLAYAGAGFNAASATTYVLGVSATAGGIPAVLGVLTAAQNVFSGQTAVFTETNLYGSTVQNYWQKWTGGVWTTLNDGTTSSGSVISGSKTTTLTIANVGQADAADYQLVATNAITTNLVAIQAPLTLLNSTNAIITQPGDVIADIGNAAASPVGQDVTKLIDGSLTRYSASGQNAGTVPFVGQVQVVITPAVGSSVLTSLRFVAASDHPLRDPADYLLEGSNDGGNTFNTISSGALALDNARNLTSTGAINVTNQVLQEVDFANATGYTTYRLTFLHNKDNFGANTNEGLLQIGEVQLLGALASVPPGIAAQPAPATKTLFVGGSLSLSVVANGPLPRNYQWYHNGNSLSGATNAALALSHIQLSDAGTYNVVVGNAYGYTTSSNVALTVLPVPAIPYIQTITGDAPLAYWPLNQGPDDGAGNNGVTAIDYVASHDGLYTNVVLGIASHSASDTNTAMAVGEQNINLSDVTGIQGINFASPAGQDGEFTVEAWVNGAYQPAGYQQTTGAGIVTLGYGGGGEQFALDCGAASNSFRFYFRDASGGSHSASASIPSADGLWHHLVGVVDGANGRQYFWVDGQLAQLTVLGATGLGILAENAPTNRFTIGWRNNSTTNALLPSRQFSGSIADVAVYNYPLSSNQVQQHYLASGVAPTFTQLPVSQTADQGSTAVFNATVYGTPNLTYQWYTSDGNNPTAPVTGQTGATLALTNVSATLNGSYYQLVAANSYGSITSPAVQLTVVSGSPAIYADIQAANEVYAGGPIVLSVTAHGSSPLVYQWQDNSQNLSDGSRISGSHSNVLTIAASQVSDSGTYQLIVSNGAGTNYSTLATVTVIPYLGFNGAGAGWAVNQNAASLSSGNGFLGNSNALQLTTAAGATEEATSAFFNTPVYVGGFQASFVYQDSTAPGGADGAAFILQNDVRGTSAISGGGGNLAYGGTGSPRIIPSFAMEMNIYPQNVIGYAFESNGIIAGPFAPSAPVALDGGNPINVLLTYLNGRLSLTLTDPIAQTTFTTNVVYNVPAAAGSNWAYVGFSGADGAIVSSQTISNFKFISLVTLSAVMTNTNTMVLSWPSGVGGYVLEKSSSLNSGVWVPVSSPVTSSNDLNQVTIPTTAANAFYRLHLSN